MAKYTKDDVLFFLAMLPMWPLGTIAVLAAFGAAGILLYRVIFFLRDGFWISSLCDFTTDAIWRGGNLPSACISYSSGWLGVDFIIEWTLRTLDATLAALLVAGIAWLLMVLWIGFCAALKDG